MYGQGASPDAGATARECLGWTCSYAHLVVVRRSVENSFGVGGGDVPGSHNVHPDRAHPWRAVRIQVRTSATLPPFPPPTTKRFCDGLHETLLDASCCTYRAVSVEVLVVRRFAPGPKLGTRLQQSRDGRRLRNNVKETLRERVDTESSLFNSLLLDK